MPANPMSEVIQHLRHILLPEGADLTDGQLLECFVSRRESAALEALVRRHGSMVWGVCRRILQNHHDAEDAFQATFLVLVRKAASIFPRTKVGNWLYGVAHQTALKARATRAKRRGREKSVTEMPEPAVEERDAGSDLQAVLDQELSRLPEKYRTVIVLCGLEGKTVRETARQLGCPQGTVASRLARARTMLAKRLTQRGVTLSSGALAAMLTEKAASAGVPSSVVSSTIKAVTLVAAGQAAATGAISVKVAALTEGVLKVMMLSKLKAVVAVVLVLGFIATGATVRCFHTASVQGEQSPAVEVRVKVPQKQEKEKEVFTAWGKEVGGLQAGLGYLPGQHRTYHTGETVTLVVRVRNVSKETVQFQYDRWFFEQKAPAVTDSAGKPVHFRYGLDDTALVHPPTNVSLAPGKEMALGEVKLPTAFLGTGKFTVQYERVFGKSYQGTLEADPTLNNLGTGKLDLEIKSEQTPAAAVTKAPEKQDQEKEGFAAWGEEASGLQAGLTIHPGGRRTYRYGETVTLTVRVRNVSKKDVKFQYLRQFLDEKSPTVTVADGKTVPQDISRIEGVHVPVEVHLAPGKEIVLESRMAGASGLRYEIRPKNDGGQAKRGAQPLLVGTGKVCLQYKRVFGNSSSGSIELDPALSKLATGKVELEIKADDDKADREKKPSPPESPKTPKKEIEGDSVRAEKEKLQGDSIVVPDVSTPEKARPPKAADQREYVIMSRSR